MATVPETFFFLASSVNSGSTQRSLVEGVCPGSYSINRFVDAVDTDRPGVRRAAVYPTPRTKTRSQAGLLLAGGTLQACDRLVNETSANRQGSAL